MRSLSAWSSKQSPPSLRPREWWREFGDEQLDQLVAQALQGNPSLKLAQARLARAQAASEVAQAARLPQASGSLDVTRQRFTANGAVPPPLAGAILNSGTLQLSASWELDFFGKNQAALDAALGSARAAQADAEAARVLLASNVARAYFQLARVNGDLAVAQRTLAQRQESLRLVQDRLQAGLDTRLELRQSEGALPEARQQIEALQRTVGPGATRARGAHRAGQPGRRSRAAFAGSSQTHGDSGAATRRPAGPTGRHRRRALAYRSRRLRREECESPVLSQHQPGRPLRASRASAWAACSMPAASNGAFGPAIRLPIFEAGRLRANLRGKTADLDAAVESYNAAVLDAIHDAADQVASSQSIARQQAEQRDAQVAAEDAYAIALQRYQAGLGTYLNVLAAETAVLSQRRLGVDLAARALDTQIALIRAFGGGYSEAANTASR